MLLNLLDDGAEKDGAGWVTHPGVELAVGLVGAQLGVTEVVAGSLGLLGEGDHVGRRGEVPVVVGPELASGTDASLHLVDDQEHAVLLGDLAQTTEEGGRGVVVATLGLDGLNDDGTGGNAVVENQVLDLGEGSLLSLLVLLDVLLQRVLEEGEGGLGPVEGGDIQLVNGLGAGGGERAKQTTVEGGLEGHDGELLGGAGRLIVHGGEQLLLGEPDVGTATLLLALPHESGLVGSLVGVGAGHGSEDLVQTLGGDLEDTGAQDLGPVVGREVAQSRAVDQCVDNGIALHGLDEVRVVVAHGNGSNLGVAIVEAAKR